MKTQVIKLLAFPLFVLSAAISGCHSGPKDSTAVADSANQKQIAATDSANKAGVSHSDSTLKANKKLDEDASKFLVKNYEAGLYEIQLSQLAATNGLGADVKNLAANMVAAHTAINASMSAIAASANFVLPAAIDADHKKDFQDIGKLNAADFYKNYNNTIVDWHEKAESAYKDAYTNLSPVDTKDFAAATLPKIQNHLAMAKKVQDRIK